MFGFQSVHAHSKWESDLIPSMNLQSMDSTVCLLDTCLQVHKTGSTRRLRVKDLRN